MFIRENIFLSLRRKSRMYEVVNICIHLEDTLKRKNESSSTRLNRLHLKKLFHLSSGNSWINHRNKI